MYTHRVNSGIHGTPMIAVDIYVAHKGRLNRFTVNNLA